MRSTFFKIATLNQFLIWIWFKNIACTCYNDYAHAPISLQTQSKNYPSTNYAFAPIFSYHCYGTRLAVRVLAGRTAHLHTRHEHILGLHRYIHSNVVWNAYIAHFYSSRNFAMSTTNSAPATERAFQTSQIHVTLVMDIKNSHIEILCDWRPAIDKYVLNVRSEGTEYAKL